MWTEHNYTPCNNPTANRLYIKILGQLADNTMKTKDEIYAAIPGTEKRTYDCGPKWVNHGLLTALVKNNLVTAFRRGRFAHKYLITSAGLALYNRTMNANA